MISDILDKIKVGILYCFVGVVIVFIVVLIGFAIVNFSTSISKSEDVSKNEEIISDNYFEIVGKDMTSALAIIKLKDKITGVCYMYVYEPHNMNRGQLTVMYDKSGNILSE